MILPSLALSSKKIPCLRVGDKKLRPDWYLKRSWQLRRFKARRIGKNLYELTCGRTSLLLTGYYLGGLFYEWPIWSRVYVPRGGVEGLTVLDVGAGCGETALKYLTLGASKVICVEPDEEAFRLLERNSRVNSWNVQLINERFRIEQLELPHDFMKMDIEGGETELLRIDYEKPFAVELHPHRIGKGNMESLILKFGLVKVGEQEWMRSQVDITSRT